MSFDILLNGLLVGGEKVGKSSLLYRYTENSFSSNYISTIGVDFKIKTASINSCCDSLVAKSSEVKLHLWDTSGAPRFAAITLSYYRGARMVYLCCDLSDSAGAQQLPSFWDQIQQNVSPANTVVAVVGCKSDEADPTCMKEASEFAESHDIQFFATSAKRNEGVEDAFVLLAAEAIEKMNDNGRSGAAQARSAGDGGGGGGEKKKKKYGFFGGWK